ncbi:MAG: PilZ domain-containing protein [Limimaricola soesokkakensis]|uniref:PilZ domain protein n=1 Tax=Limimaricola soesokkakensis TaxID=1343159 RepID=A0A1X6Y6K9_9RHOB|nr:PilZ domain-containing protein [Limimaricola soesokkakensis]PSK87330.1 PilZ domain-containing protein [Limimaricola soesokkakensis]SLN11872.1 PilZ domain protein [Limimaricola soesokkakensis]
MRYREPRFATDRELRVVYGKEIQRARLINVSATGARLGQLSQMEPDRLVLICLLHLKIPAKVVWSNEKQTGVHFLEPLSVADLQTMGATIADGASPRGKWGNHGFHELR